MRNSLGERAFDNDQIARIKDFDTDARAVDFPLDRGSVPYDIVELLWQKILCLKINETHRRFLVTAPVGIAPAAAFSDIHRILVERNDFERVYGFRCSSEAGDFLGEDVVDHIAVLGRIVLQLLGLEHFFFRVLPIIERSPVPSGRQGGFDLLGLPESED